MRAGKKSEASPNKFRGHGGWRLTFEALGPFWRSALALEAAGDIMEAEGRLSGDLGAKATGIWVLGSKKTKNKKLFDRVPMDLFSTKAS